VDQEQPRHVRDAGLIAAIVAAGLSSLFIFLYLIRPQGPFCWDEAHRSLYSLLIAKSLFAGDGTTFMEVTSSQVYWPFLHSWISALFLMVGGFNYDAARCMSLVASAASTVGVYFLGKAVAGRHGTAVGLTAAALFLLSPLVLFFAATAMAESLGTCITLMVLLAYLAAMDGNRMRLFLLAGALLALLYFTKYAYAVFVGLGLALSWVIGLARRSERTEHARMLARCWPLAVGFLVLYGLWMLSPPSMAKLRILLQRLRETGGWDFLKLGLRDRLLFYPRALLTAYTFSPWIFILYVAGIVWGFVNWRQARIRLLLLLFLANLVPMAISTNLQERFIYTMMPALFVLSSLFLVHVWSQCNAKQRRWCVFLTLVIVAGDMHKMPAYIRVAGNSTLGVLNHKAPKTRPTSTFFKLARYPSSWSQPANLLLPENGHGVAEHSMEDVFDFIWENTDPSIPLCAPVQLNSASPHLWQWHALLQNRHISTEWQPNGFYFVSLEIDSNALYRTMINLSLIEKYSEPSRVRLLDMAAKNIVRVVAEKEFSDMGMTASVYARRISHSPPLPDQRVRANASRAYNPRGQRGPVLK